MFLTFQDHFLASEDELFATFLREIFLREVTAALLVLFVSSVAMLRWDTAGEVVLEIYSSEA
jgi:hypothetical protein